MARKFYGFLKESVDSLGNMLDRLETTESLAEISKLEIGIRRKAEEIMVYAGMVPNKDALLTAMSRRKTIRSNSVSVIDQIHQTLDSISEEAPVDTKKPAAPSPEKKTTKKKSTKKKSTKKKETE